MKFTTNSWINSVFIVEKQAADHAMKLKTESGKLGGNLRPRKLLTASLKLWNL